MIYSILYIHIYAHMYFNTYIYIVVYQTELKKEILIFCHFSFPVCFLLQSYLINKERLRVISNWKILYSKNLCIKRVSSANPYIFLLIGNSLEVCIGGSFKGWLQEFPLCSRQSQNQLEGRVLSQRCLRSSCPWHFWEKLNISGGKKAKYFLDPVPATLRILQG